VTKNGQRWECIFASLLLMRVQKVLQNALRMVVHFVFLCLYLWQGSTQIKIQNDFI